MINFNRLEDESNSLVEQQKARSSIYYVLNLKHRFILARLYGKKKENNNNNVQSDGLCFLFAKFSVQTYSNFMISYSSGSHYHHLPHTSSFPENLIRDVLTERRRYMCESVKYLHLWQVSVDLNALVNSAAIHFLVRVLITSGFCSRTGLCFVLITIAAAAVLVLVSIRLPGL